VVTSIRIAEGLLDEVADSGVKNFSKYVEGLIKRDLRGMEKVGRQESKRVQQMIGVLDEIEVAWFKYLKEEGELS